MKKMNDYSPLLTKSTDLVVLSFDFTDKVNEFDLKNDRYHEFIEYMFQFYNSNFI